MRVLPVVLLSLLLPVAGFADPKAREVQDLIRSEEAGLFFSMRTHMETPADVLNTAFLGFRACAGDDPDANDIFAALDKLLEEGKLSRADLRSLEAVIFLPKNDKPLLPENGNSIARTAGNILGRFDGTPKLEVTASTLAKAPRSKPYSGRKLSTNARRRTRAHLNTIGSAAQKEIVLSEDVPDDIVVFSAKAVPWDQALDLFTEWRGLRWVESGGKITVSRRPPKK